MLQKEKWVKRERENLNAFRFGNGCGRGWGWWRGSDGRTIANSEGKLLRLQRRRRWKEGGRLDWKWENGVLGFIGRENEAVKFTRESHWWWEMKCCILSITLCNTLMLCVWWFISMSYESLLIVFVIGAVVGTHRCHMYEGTLILRFNNMWMWTVKCFFGPSHDFCLEILRLLNIVGSVAERTVRNYLFRIFSWFSPGGKNKFTDLHACHFLSIILPNLMIFFYFKMIYY